MYWGRLVKIDTALYPIFTQRNLAVTSENISMLLNPGFYGSFIIMPSSSNAVVVRPRAVSCPLPVSVLK